MPRTALLAFALCAFLSPARGQPPPPATPPAGVEPAKPSPQLPSEPAAAPQAAPAAPLLAHIETRGTGPIPLILIPAFVCDWSIYDAFMTRNADRYTMYAVTLPGFGKSDPPPAPPEEAPYSAAPWLESAVRGIVQLINDRKLDQPVVLGVSTGGHIALRVGIAAPENVRAVVTLNGLPAIPLHDSTVLPRVTRDRIVREEYASRWKSFPEDEWAREQEAWARASFPDSHRADAVIAAAAGTPKSTSGRYMLEYFASDLNDSLSSLSLPVLAISSLPRPTNSQFHALKNSWKASFARLPKAKLAFFEDSGEFLTEDSPAELDRALRQFLDGTAVDGKGAALPLPRPADPADPVAPAHSPSEPK